MAYITVTPQNAPGWWMTAGLVIGWDAAVEPDSFRSDSPADAIYLAYNSHATTSYTFSITPVADQYGRVGSVLTDTLPAGQFRVYGPVKHEQWYNEAIGWVDFDSSSSAVKVAVISLDNWRH